MNSVFRHIMIVSLLFIPGVLSARILHRPADEIKGAFKNERTYVRGDTIVVTYQLDAPADETYRVSMRLRRKDKSVVPIEIRAVKGDYGEGEFGGRSCRIVWLYRADLPPSEFGEEFFFELSCERVTGGLPWWVYAGAGGAGAVAAVLLLKKGGGVTQAGQTYYIPDPPGRPTQ
jgi:hypothetical protein